jgi:hypothetical protein
MQPSRVSVAHSLRRQARSAGAQRFGLVLDFPPMTRAEAAPIFGFCLAQDGRYGTFQYVLPNPLTLPQGVGAIGSPTPVVDSTQASPTASQTGTSINTRGWPSRARCCERWTSSSSQATARSTSRRTMW